MSPKQDKTESEAVPEVLGPDVLNTGVPTDYQIQEVLEQGNLAELADNAVSIHDVAPRPNLVDKEKLLGRPLVILGWRFNPGSYAQAFVSVIAVTLDDQKVVVFNDGSSGICQTLLDATEKYGRQDVRINCPNGLSRSQYWVDEETNETFPLQRKPADRETILANTYRFD